MKFGYVYLTTNLRNKVLTFYIGQKMGSILSKAYLGSGKRIHNSIQRFGKHNFSIRVLCWAGTQKELSTLEKKMIAKYRKTYGRRRLYNITHGGNGGAGPRSKETKEKISLANIGRKFTKEHREAISRGTLGRKKSSHELRMISNSVKMAHKNGSYAAYFKRIRDAAPKKIIYTKEEISARRSAAMKGNTNFKNRKMTPEYRAALKAAWVLRKKRGCVRSAKINAAHSLAMKLAWKNGVFANRKPRKDSVDKAPHGYLASNRKI